MRYVHTGTMASAGSTEAAAVSKADLAECRELQEQEVEALQAIFPLDEDGQEDGGCGSLVDQPQGGTTRLLACRGPQQAEEGAAAGGCWRLALDVEVTLPCPDTGIDVVIAPRAAVTASDAADEEEEEEEEPPSLRAVRYLPPIRLDVQLGPAYPLHAAPDFSIWAPWLDAEKAAWAREEMLRMWAEVYVGGPVVFSWVDWLGRELVEGLVALGEGEGSSSGGDAPRPTLVLQGPPPPSSAVQQEEEEDGEEGEAEEEQGGAWGPRLLMRLLAYTYARESEAFARGIHTCYICFDEKSGRAFATLGCGHFWCRDCLGEMARTHVRDGDVGMLVCPHPECGEELAPEVLRELLDGEAFERWERLLLSKTLDGMEDVSYCPRDQTPTIIDGGLGECPTCHFSFCAKCKEAYHGSATDCFSGEARLKQVESEIKRILDGGGRLTATQNEKLEKLRRAAEESLSRRAVEKGSRACPKCVMRVQKTEGCNKMRCRCGTLWCWTCGKDISEESYGHFREGASNCGLWEREALLAWQRQMAAMEVNRGIQGEMVRLVNWGRWGDPEEGAWARRRRGGGRARDDGIHIVRCGKCGGQHVKLGTNNHIRCQSCRAQFCALCGASNFRKASEHFGPGGCRQHS